ncbi:phage tail protein [Serratia fonticola]|uniref:phage tail assembly protein n=1 Tax=Serratia fonticola TaxID=47917 RepID=UPI000BFE7BCC|nr:phage tail assembly protein [Serratia fonticola]ATM78979.1 phage tail protein [Serratia fonticola]
MSTTKNTTGGAPSSAKTVILDVPIRRGETEITEVSIRRPSAGELRGIKLQSLLETDVNSVIKVLPRLTTPVLTEQEVSLLDPADFYSMAAELSIFFVPKAMAADLEKNTQ